MNPKWLIQFDDKLPKVYGFLLIMTFVHGYCQWRIQWGAHPQTMVGAGFRAKLFSAHPIFNIPGSGPDCYESNVM